MTQPPQERSPLEKAAFRGEATRIPRRCAAFVGLLYLLIALWAMRGVWPAPSSILLGVPQAMPISGLGNADLRMVVGVVAGNAARVVSRPWALRDEGQCHPFPRSYTLGEHMFGESLLASLPLALSGEPILAYNVVLVLTLWIPSLAMFALAWSFTRSVPAAFLAGLLFGFARVRLADPAHPYVHGDLWTPLAVLFLYRLFADERWRNALGLALFGALVLIESLYPVLAAALLLATLGSFLLVKYRRRILSLVPQLSFCVAVAMSVGWLVFVPYVETARVWGLAQGRSSIFAFPHQFTPGNTFFPGIVLAPLALLGLLDRLRGARRGAYGDPRAAMATAALLIWWCAVWAIPVPGTDLELSSPLLVAQGLAPGLDSARALAVVHIGARLALCVLSAYGALALLERMRTSIAVPLTGVLTLIVLGEAFHPALARWSFGSPLPVAPLREALPSEDAVLLRSLEEGAVLDVPPHLPSLFARGHYLLAAAYHGQSTSACYNSYPSPVTKEIAQLTDTLWDPKSAEALATLGFRTVVVHLDQLPHPYRDPLLSRLAENDYAGGRLERVGETGNHLIYRLRGHGPVARDLGLLRPAGPPSEPNRISPPDATVTFAVVNQGEAIFLHPDPIAPTAALVRWKDAEGAVVAEAETKVLLPLALAGGQRVERETRLDVPVPPGRYMVTLSLLADPDRVLGEALVEVAKP